MVEILAFKTTGGSMRPLIRNGEFLWVDTSCQGGLRPGDMVLYEASDKKFVHRILRINSKANPARYRIFDDAAVINPEDVFPGQIKGRVISGFNGLPGLLWGKAFNFLFKNGRRIKNFFRSSRRADNKKGLA